MAALSKVFWEHCKKANCGDLIHENTCTYNAIYQLYWFFISNAKYYGPVVALPTIAKFQNLNREVLMTALRYYGECVATGTAVGWTIAVTICLLRNFIGEFKYYTLLYVPSIVGGLTILGSTPRVQRLFLSTIFTGTIESILRRRKNFVSRSIADSLVLQTLIFMTSSSIILQAKQSGAHKGFWLLTPDKTLQSIKKDIQNDDSEVVNEENPNICTHANESCTMHLIKGVRSYLAFGMTLDFLKALMSSVPKGSDGFAKKFFAKLRNFKFNSAALLASYMGIYRFTNCFLNQRTNSNPNLNHHAAGFLSGLCYIFMPKLTYLSYAAMLTTQILWRKFVNQTKDTKAAESKWWRNFLKMPYGQIMFAIGLGHLCHHYCLHYKDISNISAVVIDNTTNFYAHDFLSRVIKFEKLMMSAQK